MSTRLTKQKREEIMDAVVHHAFAARSKKLVKSEQRLALQLYNSLYSAAERKRMSELPKGWLPERSKISVDFPGSYERYEFEKPQRFHAATSGTALSLQAGQPMHLRVVQHERDGDALREEIKMRRAEIRAILNSVTTVKRLIEVWPEVEQFLPEDSEPVHLPTVQVKQLNSSLGLT